MIQLRTCLRPFLAPVLALSSFLSPTLLPAAPAPDTAFDVGTGQGALLSNRFLNVILIQRDDTLMVGGSFASFNGVTRDSLVRLTAGGVVDTGYDARFNENSSTFNATVTSMVPAADDKVVVNASALLDVAGVTNFITPVIVGNTPVRLNPGGGRDATFVQGEAGDLRAAQNGKILLYHDLSLRRLNENGTVDQTFLQRPGEFGSITVQPDGKLLIFGYPYSGFTNNSDFPVRSTNMFFRLNADGSFDNTFAVQFPVQAIVSQPAPGTINKAVVQTDGKIIVVGNFAWLGNTVRGGIARLNSNGTIDTTFNSARGFTQIFTIPNIVSYTNSGNVFTVGLQADGKVVVGGSFGEYNGATVANLVRLNANGSLDTSFAPGAVQSIGWIGFQSTGDLLVSGGSVVGFSNPLIGQPVYTNGPLAGRGIVRFAGTPPVPQPPVLSVQPQNQSVTNYFAETGPTVEFSVVAAGTAPFTYQWLFNGTPLANGFLPAGPPFIAGGNAATLVISNVSTRNAGRYSCLVSNAAGRATSAAATLTVNGSATPDLTRPVLAVTSPAATVTRVTSNTVNFAGTATDAAGIAGVWYQRGDEPPVAASLAGSTWSAPVALLPGTNVLRFHARDLSGNDSLTNRRALVYVVTLPLNLAVTGQGTVRGATDTQPLELGKRYTLTAVPAGGHVFSNWTGSLPSPSNVLSFVMASNLALTANFVPNPFPSAAGNYNGLYQDAAHPGHATRGFVNALIRPDGTFSGRLQNGLVRWPISGRFNLEGHTTNLVRRTGASDVLLELSLDLNGADTLTGRIVADTWTAEIDADRAIYNAARPSPYTNKYTLLIPGQENGAVAPAGHGFGTATIAAPGMVMFSGTLADGTLVSQAVPHSRDGVWPLYLPAYGGKGSVFGWVSITNSDFPDLGGMVNWARPSLPLPRYYTNGFSFDSMLIGSAYRAPGTNRLLNLETGTVSFSGGNLPAAFTNTVAFGPSARVTNTSPNRLTLTLTPATGALNGSVTRPDTNKVFTFKGALLQKQGIGGGFFLGTNESGRVLLGP